MNDELEKQYLLYLEKVGLNIKKMPLSQQIELERAFMGACSQILFLFFEKLRSEDPDAVIDMLDNMFFEVKEFWDNQMKIYNTKYN